MSTLRKVGIGLFALASASMISQPAIAAPERVRMLEKMPPRADGSTITITGPANARVANAERIRIIENISANLPGKLSDYKLSDIESAVETARTSPGASGPLGVTIQLCWQGKRRQWCIGVQLD